MMSMSATLSFALTREDFEKWDWLRTKAGRFITVVDGTLFSLQALDCLRSFSNLRWSREREREREGGGERNRMNHECIIQYTL